MSALDPLCSPHLVRLGRRDWRLLLTFMRVFSWGVVTVLCER